MPQNGIRSINTIPLESESGVVLAIMMAIDVSDLMQANDLVQLAVEAFKTQRTCSPPETSALLITLIGAMSAQDFARRWQAATSGDVVLRHFMARLKTADVLHGTSAGEVLETVSLRP